MLIGDKIKELRIDKGLLQKELAQQIHIAANTLSQFEAGKANPSYDVLLSLADFFEVSTDYLLGREDEFGLLHSTRPADELTKEERQLVDDYRALAPDLQKMLRATIQTWKGTEANEERKKNKGAV